MAKGARSSSRSSASTNTQNLNLQGIDGLAVAGVDGSVAIETTDHGAIEVARDVSLAGFAEISDVAGDALATGERAMDLVDDSHARSLDFAADISHGFRESTESMVGDFTEGGITLVSQLMDFVGNAGNQIIKQTAAIQKRESGNTDARLEEITHIALIGAGVVAVAGVFLAARK